MFTTSPLKWTRFFSVFLALVMALASPAALAAPKAYLRSDFKLIVNDKEYTTGFFTPYYDLEQSLSDNSEAMALYNDYVYLMKWGTALNWGALGVALTYLFSSQSNYNSGTFWTIFLIPWVSGIVVSVKGQKKFMQAINIYNGVPADKAELAPTSQWLLADARNSSPVLSVSWSF